MERQSVRSTIALVGGQSPGEASCELNNRLLNEQCLRGTTLVTLLFKVGKNVSMIINRSKILLIAYMQKTTWEFDKLTGIR